MNMRYVLTDRAGNLIPNQVPFIYHETQASAISASRRYAPCWILQERQVMTAAKGLRWKHNADIGWRDGNGNFHLSAELEKE